MKKKSAPVPEISKAAAKPKPAPRKPLFASAVAAAKKMLKGGRAKKTAETETEVDATTVVRRSYLRKKKADVPSILLEGDAPAASVASGPGEKFSLGATPPAQSFSGGELPDAYGTKKLFLTARDPHWLYAHWDLTREQQQALNGESTDGHLILRVFAHKIEGHPLYEIHVHPESRHWFAHVERAGTSYAAELGCYSALGKWMRVAVSSGTVTPPDAASKEDAAEFATIPFELPFAKLMQIIEDAVRDNIPLAQAIEELRRHGHPDLPRLLPSANAPAAAFTAPGPARVWTPQQEQALAKIINIDQSRRIWMGSLEITELIRRQLSRELASQAAAQFSQTSSWSGAITSLSSPPGGGGAARPKGFWFNINAELIIYGATEPDAKVSIGGRKIKLRPDGSFSFRFAFPDGEFELPAIAVSADGEDGRVADLGFRRSTDYSGDVGQHPQDPALKSPTPQNVA